MPFLNAIVYGYKNFFNFRGKASRSQYWFFFLFGFLVNFALNLVQLALPASYKNGLTIAIMLSSSLISLSISIPQLALTVRRFRDAGFSALWLLLDLLPAIGLVWLVGTYFADLSDILTLGGVSVHSVGEWVTAARVVLALLLSPDASVYAPYFSNCLVPFAFTVITQLGVLIFSLIVLTRPSKPEAVSKPAVDSEATA